MPFYDYYCYSCETWRRDEWYHMISDAPATLPCPACHGVSEKMPGFGATMGSSYLPGVGRIFGTAPVSGAKNIFEGTKLADSDGKNRYHYKSKKVQIDLGST